MDSSTLLADLDAEELIIEAPPAIAWKLGIVDTADGVAQFMYRGGPYPTASADCEQFEDRRPDKSYWQAVKVEKHHFLCTDDKRYKNLWKRIAELGPTHSLERARFGRHLRPPQAIAVTALPRPLGICLRGRHR